MKQEWVWPDFQRLCVNNSMFLVYITALAHDFSHFLVLLSAIMSLDNGSAGGCSDNFTPY
jgi:hypothetical protein